MNYPLWEIPLLGGPWVIGLIAIFHIYISHFAVGGGIFLAITEGIAFKNQDQKLYQYLKKHAQFFLLLTTVAGAVSGVGIWTSISLVNPAGTHSLIQVFTLGWACEYLFFVAELATIFVYYYTWDKVSPKTHLTLARWYGFMSIMTLVIINGILTFMLTPGNWLNSHYWLEGFFNQTYFPSLIIRILVMLALAGMYSLLTASLIKSDADFRTRMLRYAAKWFIPIFILGPVVAYWYFTNLPPHSLETVFSGIQTSGIGNFSIMSRALYLSLFISGTLLVFVFVGPYLNPQGFSFKMALLFALCGLVVTGITEWSRELLRKPYVIYDYMYANGLLKNEIPRLNQEGFTKRHLFGESAQLSKNPTQLGKAMFTYQCMSCHTVNGYRSMRNLLGDRDEKSIKLFLETLHQGDSSKNPYRNIMPPLVGTPQEVDALAHYLSTIQVPSNH